MLACIVFNAQLLSCCWSRRR